MTIRMRAERESFAEIMTAKDAEGLFRKTKPASETSQDDQARALANMAKLRTLRLARDKADREKDQMD
jgi:hypothetical protein